MNARLEANAVAMAEITNRAQLGSTTIKERSSRREEAHFNLGSLAFPNEVSLLTSAATKAWIGFNGGTANLRPTNPVESLKTRHEHATIMP